MAEGRAIDAAGPDFENVDQREPDRTPYHGGCAAAVAERVDDRGDPRRSGAIVQFSMVRALAIGDDPAHLSELSVEDVIEHLRLRNDDVGGPLCAGASERAVERLRAQM